jgi:hypothetical protein
MSPNRSQPGADASLPDLEIRIMEARDEGYPVEITLDGEQALGQGLMDASVASWTPGGDPAADGRWLLDALLADGPLRKAWHTATGKAPLRIRLRIDPAAARLHHLPWELLQEDAGLLAAHAGTPFSRYLPIRLPWSGAVDERPLRALVAISNPDDLSNKYGLQPVDVAQERQALAAAFDTLGPGQIEVTFLDPPVTLERLEAALREAGGYHILHVLAHGLFSAPREQAFLLLQDDEGLADEVPDDALSGMLARQKVRPWLVFLAACQSATRSTRDAFAGLGPKLVQVGVPAVVAMQEAVLAESARKFSGAFYRQLLDHGTVDQAANEARSTLLTAGQPDAAVPVLFMRLRSGQLWGAEADARGEAPGDKPRTFWEGLAFNIEDGICVPILGPRVHGRWLPAPAEIARTLADKHGYPYSNREELARVAQYLAGHHGTLPVQRMLARTMRETLAARLPKDLRPDPLPTGLTPLIEKIGWANLAAGDPNEPHQVLAGLDIPLYLTTNADSFLVEALRARGKEPVREVCCWNKALSGLTSAFDDPNYEPTVQAPLVYHLLGSDQHVQSLVLAEDDYLDFLVRISAQAERIPNYIRGRLASSSLLFLGYQLHDWEFRVILRGLVANLDHRLDINHVAVQLEGQAVADREAVREFLKMYFQAAHIDVYWGTTAQFVAELREYWQEGHP